MAVTAAILSGAGPALVAIVFSGASEGDPQVVVQLDGGPGAFGRLDGVIGEAGLVLEDDTGFSSGDPDLAMRLEQAD